MKSLKLHILLSTLFITHITQTHDQEKHLTIVTINTKEVFDKSLRGKDIIQKINTEQASLTAGFPSMQTAIKSKEAAIEQQQNNYNEKIKGLEAKSKMLSEEARNKEIDTIQDIRRQIEESTAERERLIRKFNEEAKKAEQRLESLYKKEFTSFETEVRDIIETAKIEHNWDIIHPKEALLGASDRTDKTEIIINKLNNAELKRREAKQAEKKPATPAPKKAA